MTAMQAARRRGVIALVTLALLGLAVAAAGAVLAWERRAELATAGQSIHRQLSQRVDQHDAHLTSLSALTQATQPPPVDALAQVAASIRQFYGRITAIDVIAYRGGEAVSLLREAAPAEVVAAGRTAGAAATLTAADDGGLLLAKRAGPEGDFHHAIVLTIDPARLVAMDQPLPARAALRLSLGERVLVRQGGEGGRVVFQEPLASRTQPLTLTMATLAGAWGGLWALPPAGLLAVLAAVALVGALAADRFLDATGRAREAARRAARAAQDARLAHAGRINAMGEMASGIAHELTQPLTAILSQAQAGQRLAQRPDLDRERIAGAFEAAARNARRAGAILARLRSWIAKGETSRETIRLAALADEVAGLMRLNGLPEGLEIEVAAARPGPAIVADRTQIEQVVYNLLRNAIEAVAEQPGARRVRLAVQEEGGQAMVIVEDSGPGLSAEARAHLFEPFFTTKPQGMGLGLSLCATLVERFGGTLTGGDSGLGGAAFRVGLPLASEEAAR